jgi:hypothetical protein
MMANSTFTTYDYLVLILILAISLFIGLYFGFKSKLKCLIKFNRITADKNEIELKESNDLKEKNESEKNENQVSEYLTANSSMNLIPVALSLLATFYSSASLLGMVSV